MGAYEHPTRHAADTPLAPLHAEVAASHHAQHNPNALLRKVVTVQDVLDSPMVSNLVSQHRA